MEDRQKVAERPSPEVSRVVAAAGLGTHVATCSGQMGRRRVLQGMVLAVPAAYLVVSTAARGLSWWWLWAALVAVLGLAPVVVALDPRAGRVRVYGFTGGLVRRDREAACPRSAGTGSRT